MSTAKWTLYGMIDYCAESGNSLFSGLELPDGVDKNTFIESLIIRGGEFEILYSNPDFMREAVTSWGHQWLRTFTKWVQTLQIEYNPLENYDRFEDWTDNTSGTGNTSNESKVSAFNSDVMRPDSASSGSTGFNNNNVRHGRTHGNIGVTTSQQMLESELDVAVWNLYDHMCDIFLEAFTIPIY